MKNRIKLIPLKLTKVDRKILETQIEINTLMIESHSIPAKWIDRKRVFMSKEEVGING